MSQQLFVLGQTYVTPGALAACLSFPMPPDVLFVRHVSGDWAEMGRDDQVANLRAIQDGSRVLSAYVFGEYKFYVITEGDRRATTLLLAEEY